MQKNLYYRSVIRRENLFLKFIYDAFSVFATYARLLLEVFIRKEFGERYFKLASAITVAVILALIPRLANVPTELLDGEEEVKTSFIKSPWLTWYVFIGLFLLMSIKHYRDMKTDVSVYDFKKWSLYSGKINPFFKGIKIGGQEAHIRLIETVLEPAPFLILGIILWYLGQKLGILLTISSVMYSISYLAAYDAGDNFIMDKIDEIIANEELKNTFVEGAKPEQTRGFRMYGRTPVDPEQRRRILPLMIEEDTDAQEVR